MRILRTLFALPFALTAGLHAEIASASAIVKPPTNSQSLRIDLLMGQSNMAGRDTRALRSQSTNPRGLALTAAGQWGVAKDPTHQKDGCTEPGAGPGIPFALEMIKTDPGVTVGLVPCAVGDVAPIR